MSRPPEQHGTPQRVFIRFAGTHAEYESTPVDDKCFIELDMIPDMVEEYEMEHYPIQTPSLTDTLKLRMYEMGLTQTKLAEMLGISCARMSEIISGKGEPSVKTGREMCRKLNIDPSVVLGV